MFWLQKFEDTIRIQPKDQLLPRYELLKFELNNKFSNTIHMNIGLLVQTWDILKTQDSYIDQSDGYIDTKILFRATIFRPFPQEVLVGKIYEMDETGVLVSLMFFKGRPVARPTIKNILGLSLGPKPVNPDLPHPNLHLHRRPQRILHLQLL